jgi:hypothetical protein
VGFTNSKFQGLVINSRTNALNCYDVLIGVTTYMVIVDWQLKLLKAVVVPFGHVHHA